MIFATMLWENPQKFFMICGVVVFSICLHEYAHARTALYFGDTTASDRGHLTLNPLKQMGPISLIMLLLMGIAWGAVPVDPNRLRMRGRKAEVLVSFAGPATNLFLVLCGAAVLFVTVRLISTAGLSEKAATLVDFLRQVAFVFVVYNVVLFVINMIPVPGLDGWKVFEPILPPISTDSERVKGIMMFLILVIFFCVPYLFQAGYLCAKFVIQLAEMTL